MSYKGMATIVWMILGILEFQSFEERNKEAKSCDEITDNNSKLYTIYLIALVLYLCLPKLNITIATELATQLIFFIATIM